MKRYLIFLITFAYALTGAWAADPTVELSGGTLTINSTEPGSLSGYNFSNEEKAATTLVLEGQFADGDLNKLRDSRFNYLTTVNMSEAYFLSTNNRYKVFSSEEERDNSTGNNNSDKSAVGTLYKSVSQSLKEWKGPDSNVDPNYWNIVTATFSEAELADHVGEAEWYDQYNIKYVRVAIGYNYYEKIDDGDNNYHWILMVNPTEEEKESAANAPSQWTVDGMQNNSYSNQGGDAGSIIRIATGYNYYHIEATTKLVWEPQTLNSEGEWYDLGSRIYSSESELNNNAPAQENLYALVGGSKKVYEGAQWVDEGPSYEWNKVKFNIWSNTLQTAFLPVSADPSEFASDIFQNCSDLTRVVFAEGEANIGEKPESGATPITISATNSDVFAAIKAAMISFGYQETTTNESNKYVYVRETVETNYNNPPTLVIGTTDTDNIVNEAAETKSLTTIISEQNASGYQTISFADGSTYDKSTGVLQCSSPEDYAKLEAWLNASGAEVNEVKFGKYVSIKDGVTIIDNTTADKQDPLIGQNLNTNTYLNNAEKLAIEQAQEFKFKGKFTDDDFMGIRNSNGVGGTSLDLSEAYISQDQTLTLFQTTLTELKLPQYFYDFDDLENAEEGEPGKRVAKIPDDFAKNYTALATLVLPNTIQEVGEAAFQGCTLLNDITWGTGLQVIGAHAFERCGLGPTLTIPSSVTNINEDAFRDCSKITYLYIPSDSQLKRIEEGAFFYDGDGGLKEVHVECNKWIWCDVYAFDDHHTNGHSDVATAKCRLFYPAVGVDGYDGDGENDSFEDYVGNFKAKCFNEVLNQADLDHLKTVVNDGMEINGTQYGPYPGHGWYMFTSSGILFGKETSWRTYSEAVPFYVPSEDAAKFYLAWGVAAGENGPAAESSGLVVKLVQMKPRDVVPANTGVLVNYNTATQGQSGVLMLDYAKGNNTPRYDAELEPNSKYTKNGTQYTNYLRKINNETLTIRNVELDASKNPTYRNFFFGNVDQLDKAEQYWGEDFEEVIHNYKDHFSGWVFLRAQTGDYPINNKAYLHLPASLTESTSDYSDRVDDEGKKYETRLMGIIITDGDEATSVKEGLTTPSHVTDGYYTLQGQKVSVPNTRGLYIKNGKKVIVK